MYLLDTSVISDIVNDKSARHAVVKHFVQSNQLFVDQMFVSHVTLAEMRFGRELFLLRNPAPTQIRIDELDRHIAEAEKISEPLQLSRHVTVEYGRLRAA